MRSRQRKSCGVLLSAVLAAAVVAGATRIGAQQASPSPAPQKLTFGGDVALWTVAIKPDKTAAFEQIMSRVKDALLQSSDPVRQRDVQERWIGWLEKYLNGDR